MVCLEIGWEIKDMLKERIMVIDGAMGTMVQKHKLEEEDFRYSFFGDAPQNAS